MAGEDQEKTEEPTSKKIEDARQEGNVPKSQRCCRCGYAHRGDYFAFVFVGFYG